MPTVPKRKSVIFASSQAVLCAVFTDLILKTERFSCIGDFCHISFSSVKSRSSHTNFAPSFGFRIFCNNVDCSGFEIHILPDQFIHFFRLIWIDAQMYIGLRCLFYIQSRKQSYFLLNLEPCHAQSRVMPKLNVQPSGMDSGIIGIDFATQS